MKNSAEQGGFYPQRPKAEVDNILRDLQNSPYSTKAAGKGRTTRNSSLTRKKLKNKPSIVLL